MNSTCWCGKLTPFESCCAPYISGDKKAPDAETLMRSRYSAYATQQFQYILDTYAEKQRQLLSLSQLSADADETQWLFLNVESSNQAADKATVTFSAFYKIYDTFYKMRECSSFIVEDGQWRYTKGNISDDSGQIKPKRNEGCFCGSGLKFKRCCGK